MTRRIVKGDALAALTAGTELELPPCPYGEPGQILRVREAFRIEGSRSHSYRSERVVWGNYLSDLKRFEVSLNADEWAKFREWKQPGKGKPPMYMFASLSRLFLRVESVRVQRLQDISQDDVLAEGVRIPCHENRPILRLSGKFLPADYWPVKTWDEMKQLPNLEEAMLRAEYASLWESIHGLGSWELNSWVWVLNFSKVKQ